MDLTEFEGLPHPDDITKIVGFDGSLVTRRVVCAANLTPDGIIIMGARHHDGTMRKTSELLNIQLIKLNDQKQGFVDQFGNFLTRKEAYRCVIENKQQVNGKLSLEKYDELYSEHLY